jgi:DNA-binding transcriptional LysR family regulator
MQQNDWDDLRFFLAVAEAGSLSRAAKVLRVTHSTVLRRLSRLESRLGSRLFERLHTGYVPTQAGEALRERLASLASGIESAQRELKGLDSVLSGAIRVTSTDTLARGLLMPALVAFRRQHPGIRLEVAVNNAFLNLTQREADVAVRPSNAPPENLVGRLVGTIQTALYASRRYLRGAARRGLKTTDWPRHDWVALDQSLAHLAQSKWVQSRIPAERIAVRVDSLTSAADAVRQGFGVGMLLCLLAEQDRELVRLAPPPSAPDTQLWVLTHPDLRRVQRIRTFMEHLVDALRQSRFVIGPSSAREAAVQDGCASSPRRRTARRG